MRYSTVIFDLDGTLLDTLDDLTDAVNATLRQFSYPERSREEVREFTGNGATNLIRRSLGCEPENFSEILAWYDRYYTAHSVEKTAPYPGLRELLKELCRREVKLAVVSNKQDHVVKALVRRFFRDSCTVAVGESARVRRKPAPDAVLAAMKELYSEKYECVYVGDSEVDVATAKNAGIDCITVSWGFRSRETLEKSGAAVICSRPEELLREI